MAEGIGKRAKGSIKLANFKGPISVQERPKKGREKRAGPLRKQKGQGL